MRRFATSLVLLGLVTSCSGGVNQSRLPSIDTDEDVDNLQNGMINAAVLDAQASIWLRIVPASAFFYLADGQWDRAVTTTIEPIDCVSETFTPLANFGINYVNDSSQCPSADGQEVSDGTLTVQWAPFANGLTMTANMPSFEVRNLSTNTAVTTSVFANWESQQPSDDASRGTYGFELTAPIPGIGQATLLGSLVATASGTSRMAITGQWQYQENGTPLVDVDLTDIELDYTQCPQLDRNSMAAITALPPAAPVGGQAIVRSGTRRLELTFADCQVFVTEDDTVVSQLDTTIFTEQRLFLQSYLGLIPGGYLWQMINLNQHQFALTQFAWCDENNACRKFQPDLVNDPLGVQFLVLGESTFQDALTTETQPYTSQFDQLEIDQTASYALALSGESLIATDLDNDVTNRWTAHPLANFESLP